MERGETQRSVTRLVVKRDKAEHHPAFLAGGGRTAACVGSRNGGGIDAGGSGRL